MCRALHHRPVPPRRGSRVLRIGVLRIGVLRIGVLRIGVLRITVLRISMRGSTLR